MTVILNFLLHPHLQVKESCNNLRYIPETPSAFKMDFALRKLDEPVKVENRRWDSFVLVSELVEFAWVVSEVRTGFTVLRSSCSAPGQGSRTQWHAYYTTTASTDFYLRSEVCGRQRSALVAAAALASRSVSNTIKNLLARAILSRDGGDLTGVPHLTGVAQWWFAECVLRPWSCGATVFGGAMPARAAVVTLMQGNAALLSTLQVRQTSRAWTVASI